MRAVLALIAVAATLGGAAVHASNANIKNDNGVLVAVAKDMKFNLNRNEFSALDLKNTVDTNTDDIAKTSDDLKDAKDQMAKDLAKAMSDAVATSKATFETFSTTLKKTVDDSQEKSAGDFATLKKELETELSAFQCTNGQFYDDKTKKCGASMIQLKASPDTKCAASTKGLIKLDDKAQSAVICDGKTFSPVGAPPPAGLSPAFPAKTCKDIKVGTVYTLKSGVYYITKPKGAAAREYCDMEAEPPISMGGDGSNPDNAAVDCFTLKFQWGITKDGDYYTGLGSGTVKKVTCKFSEMLGRPQSIGSGKLDGAVNRYAMITKDYSAGYSGAISLKVGSKRDEIKTWKAGDLVMVVQMQNAGSGNSVGVYEWNMVAAIDADQGTVKLANKLENSYVSGAPNKVHNSKVAQLIRVPYYMGLGESNWGTVTASTWNGETGGVIAIRTIGSMTVGGTVDASCQGFRGGRRHATACGCGGGCQAHGTAGEQGEGWGGMGKMDKRTAGFGCCRGPINKGPAGYGGRGRENRGGGGGGAGACHGGGGAGGGHRTFNGISRCSRDNSRCRFQGNIGDGAPECTRAGSYSQRGGSYGDSKLARLTLGGGGGAGNSYSPSTYDDNSGGKGGGVIFLQSDTSNVKITGRVRANGCQGEPNERTSNQKFTRWWRVNTQDGSGGGGGGGSIMVSAPKGTADVGSNKLETNGGKCGAYTGWPWGWNSAHQHGGPGAFGYTVAKAKSVSGSAKDLIKP